MVINEPKCIKCVHYNKNDYEKLSCKYFKNIPQDILIDEKECQKYEKEENRNLNI